MKKKSMLLLVLAMLLPFQHTEVKLKKIECFKPHKYLTQKRSGKHKK